MDLIRHKLWIFVFCTLWIALFAQRSFAEDEILRAALELRAKYAADIKKLADWCDENGLGDEARKTRLAIGPNDPHKLFVPVLPDEVGPPDPPAGASPKALEWHKRFWQIRREGAVSFFDLARRAVRGGRAGLAFDLALASIQANPDCEPVRRMFSYQKYGGRWRTIYEVRKLRSGNVWSDKFGWLPKGRLHKYGQGERYLAGRWISAEEDAQRHADINTGWDIETEHYSIRTNHSIEAAVAVGKKLETLYRLWRQMFVRYFCSQADMVSLFDGRGRPGSGARPKFHIVLFRDRDDYNRSLRASMPNIGISTGVYVESMRRAYFFVGPDSDDRTLYHEATHQLFHESRPVVNGVGSKSNFWIVEGIAMFMESLRSEDGFHILGGFDDERVHAARYRLLHDDFYVPLGELVDFSMVKLQEDPRIAKLYSQSAGLTNFLVFYDGGRYRDAVVSYLLAVYTGRANRSTLSRLTGTDYPTLDEQYRQFLKGNKTKP